MTHPETHLPAEEMTDQNKKETRQSGRIWKHKPRNPSRQYRIKVWHFMNISMQNTLYICTFMQGSNKWFIVYSQ